MLRASRPTRLGDTKLPCDVAHASVVCPGGSIAHISSDKALLLCQDERPRASQALMRHAWRDRAYPGACEAVLASVVRVSLLSERQAEPRHASPTAGRETTPCRHQRCPGLALRAADTLLTPTRGAPPRARIATASACMLPTPSRILHGHGGKRRRRVQGGEAAAGPYAETRREALAQRQDGLVVSSRGGCCWGAQHLQDTLRGTRGPLCPQPL